MKNNKYKLPVIGVTGPSGAGKSVFCGFLAKKGYRVLDCDKIYKRMTVKPSECLRELSLDKNFGPGILLPDGSLDRRKTASIVFAPGNKDKLELLNRITHKYVTKSIKRSLSRPGKGTRGFVIDAPLLFQAGIENICDLTVALLADRGSRAERIKIRDNIPEDAIESRLSAAMDDEYFSSRADVTVVNNGSKEELERNAELLLLREELGNGF